MDSNRITLVENDQWPYNPNFQDFVAFLGLPAEKDSKGTRWNYDQKTAQRIEELYKWGIVKVKSFDHEKVKEVIYNLQKKIGTNWIGKSLVDKLWQYIQFDSNYSQKIVEMLNRKKAEQIKDQDYIDLEQVDKRLKKPEKEQPSEISKIKMRKTEYKTYNATPRFRKQEMPEVKTEVIPI